MHFKHPDSYRVDTEDSVMFKHFMNSDKIDFQRSKPAYPMFYDTDHNYRKDRDYWLKLLLGMGFVTYAGRKI
jgi:hypothetical protein